MNPVAAKLVSILIDIARAIGRWVVKKLVNLGIKKGLPWMEKKIATFRRRRERARVRNWPLRERWLKGKIERWGWAIAQVRKHGKSLADKAVRAYCKAADTALAKVPFYASAEKCPDAVVAESGGVR
jgi:hypothetical protein